jgi:hypothetical protein
MNLELTELDTTPISCRYSTATTGHTFVLNAICDNSGDTVTINSVLVNAELGTYKFPRLSTDFTPGSYTATIQTNYPDGTVDTSELFIINVASRTL